MNAREGFVDVLGYQSWYRVVGDLSTGPTPLLLLHGGPGGASDYFEPIEQLAASGRAVIRYDQLGSGRSDRPSDPSLWTLDTFVQELAIVRKELGVDRVHLLGQSWGGTLAIEYALRRPRGLESLVLYSTVVDWARYLQGCLELRAALPEWSQRVMRRYENGYSYKPKPPSNKVERVDAQQIARLAKQAKLFAPLLSKRWMQRLSLALSFIPFMREFAYAVASSELTRRHSIRVDPIPDCALRAFAGMGREVYETMWGPTEFFATGTMKDFDHTSRLHEIDVPTLIVTGRYDAVRPHDHAEVLRDRIPGAEMICFDEASHTAHLEEPELFERALTDFLGRVDAKA